NIQIFDNDEFIPNVSDTETENDDETSWIELIEDEIQDSEIEETNIVENYDITIANISQITHPVNDIQAKWILCDIFTDNLEFPSYLESFI
ncbi:15416_t:CDS:2, partial [Funneliformis geosporum]